MSNALTAPCLRVTLVATDELPSETFEECHKALLEELIPALTAGKQLIRLNVNRTKIIKFHMELVELWPTDQVTFAIVFPASRALVC